MTTEEWTLAVDVTILVVLVVWSVMDRCNIYLRK